MAVPTLAEVLRDMTEARVRGIYTSTVGRVNTYNVIAQTVDVELVMLEPINVLNEEDLEHVEHPVLPDVPIAWPRAGGFSIYMPPAKGDTVLLIFTHESIAMWRETGSKSIPGDLRRHDLSNAIAIPGVASQLGLLTDLPSPTMPLDEMVINGPGVVRVGGQLEAKFVALSDKVDAAIASIVTFINTHTHLTAGLGSPVPPAPLLSAPPSVAASKLKAQ